MKPKPSKVTTEYLQDLSRILNSIGDNIEYVRTDVTGESLSVVIGVNHDGEVAEKYFNFKLNT